MSSDRLSENQGKKVVCIFFVVLKIICTFAVTNQIFHPFRSVWFLLRRAERLGSAKPWQPIPNNREKGAKT
jgi:hypothetical protein